MRVDTFVWCQKSRFETVKNALVVVPKKTHDKQEIKPFVLYEEKGGLIGLPRGWFFDYWYKGEPYEDCTVKGVEKQLEINSSFSFRPEQVELIENTLRALKGKYGGVVVASGGFGKTVCGLGLANKIGLFPVLIVVHRRVLINQWIKEIRRVFKQASVGVIMGERYIYKNCDFVIGMLESLAIKDYPEDLYQSFACVIFDECHRISTPVFIKAVKKFPARYLIGLTATPERADRTEKVFFYLLGKILATYKKQMLIPKVRVVYIPAIDGYSSNLSSLITKLSLNPVRNKIIVDEIKKAYEAGRWIIVLSDRIKHLELLKEMISDATQTAIIVGGSSREEVEEAKKKRIILSTYQFLSEGFDDPRRDTLFLATPRVHIVKQAVGRILREHPDKKDPVVVDFVDSYEVLKKLYYKRREIYNKFKQC